MTMDPSAHAEDAPLPLSDTASPADVRRDVGDATITADGESRATSGSGVQTPVTSGAREILSRRLARPQGDARKYAPGPEIGRGGVGIVRRCVDIDLRRDIAMKVLKRSDADARYVRFIEEAQVTGQLEHPNIVPVHDLGIDAEGRPFFTMKLVAGSSLDEILEARRTGAGDWSLGRLLQAVISICNGIAYAHEHRVIHRDLKPANIMLGDFGEVLVMDWGLARIGRGGARRVHSLREELKRHARLIRRKQTLVDEPTDDESDERFAESLLSVVDEPDPLASLADDAAIKLTHDGMILGTPVYMPPEQARGAVEEIDERSDIYSLGAILYEILTGQPPVSGADTRAILEAVRAGRIIPPRQCAPRQRIPAELAAIAMKALAFDPDQRYQQVAELRRDIERFTEGRSVSAKDDHLWEAFSKLVRRNKAMAMAIGVFLTILVVTTTIAFVVIVEYWQKAERSRAEARQALTDYLAEQEAHSALQEEVEQERARHWRQIYEEYWEDPNLTAWQVATTDWRADPTARLRPLEAVDFRNMLRIQGHGGLNISLDRTDNLHLIYRQPIGGSMRVSLRCTVLDEGSGGTHIVLGGSAWNRGYIFQFGGWQGTDKPRSAIMRGDGLQPRFLAESDVVPRLGEQQQIEASLVRDDEGAHLRFVVDGQTVLEALDRDPLLSPDGEGDLALWWATPSRVQVPRITIARLGEALRSDILDIAERHLGKGNYDTAYDLFEEIAETTTDPERRQRGIAGMERAHELRQLSRATLQNYRRRLARKYPEEAWRLTINEGVLTATLSGDQITGLHDIRDMPIQRLTLHRIASNRLDILGQSARLAGLSHLTIVETDIASLAPLRGLALQSLTLVDCGDLSDLSPLAGMPLGSLALERLPALSDLSPLVGCPLETVELRLLPHVRDLGPIATPQLTTLDIRGSLDLADLTPLRHTRLQHLILDTDHIDDRLAVLRDLPNLQRIGVGNDFSFEIVDFWEYYDSRFDHE